MKESNPACLLNVHIKECQRIGDGLTGKQDKTVEYECFKQIQSMIVYPVLASNDKGKGKEETQQTGWYSLSRWSCAGKRCGWRIRKYWHGSLTRNIMSLLVRVWMIKCLSQRLLSGGNTVVDMVTAVCWRTHHRHLVSLSVRVLWCGLLDLQV